MWYLLDFLHIWYCQISRGDDYKYKDNEDNDDDQINETNKDKIHFKTIRTYSNIDKQQQHPYNDLSIK